MQTVYKPVSPRPAGQIDDTQRIQNAIDAAFNAGGGVVELDDERYAIGAAADLIVKRGVAVRGTLWTGGLRNAAADWSTVDQAFILDPSHTIILHRNSLLQGISIHRKGLLRPTTLRQALDYKKLFAGTAVRMGNGIEGDGANPGSDSAIRDCFIIGFNWGIYSDLSDRVTIQNVKGDCTNGLYMGRNYDVSNTSAVSWFPFLTANISDLSALYYNATAAVDNGNGTSTITFSTTHQLQAGDQPTGFGFVGSLSLNQRVTVQSVPPGNTQVVVNVPLNAPYVPGSGKFDPRANAREGTAFTIFDTDSPNFTDCFEYGHKIGWHLLDGCVAGSFKGCSSDSFDLSRDGYTSNVRIEGTSARNKLIGGTWTSKGTPLFVDTTGADTNSVVGVYIQFGVFSNRAVEAQRGRLALIGCDIAGTIYKGSNDPQSLVSVVGGDLRLSSVTGFTNRVIVSGVHFGSSVAGAVGQLRGGTGVEIGLHGLNPAFSVSPQGFPVSVNMPGFYADDLAAYTAGVPFKGLYLRSGTGVVACQVTYQ